MQRRVLYGFLFIGLLTFVISGCAQQEEEVIINLPEEELSAFMSDEEVVEDEAQGLSSLQRGEWKGLPIYLDYGYFRNHFIPSGWMGDHGDMKINPNWKENPYSRKSCIKIGYTAKSSQGNGWSGVYWQNPENNWGMRPNVGFDLTPAKKLTFWARGDKGGEVIREFKMGGISGAYPDTDSASIGPVTLTPEWKQYT
ncbi:MAG: hypothetical protein ABH875_05240, partial [Candidatus Omnitrophota bacterium]